MCARVITISRIQSLRDFARQFIKTTTARGGDAYVLIEVIRRGTLSLSAWAIPVSIAWSADLSIKKTQWRKKKKHETLRVKEVET